MSENTENTLTAYLGPEFQQRLIWQLLVEPEFAEKLLPDLAIEYPYIYTTGARPANRRGRAPAFPRA